jgi:hypothetical protein
VSGDLHRFSRSFKKPSSLPVVDKQVSSQDHKLLQQR